ncbi:hypothetical protein [Parendozoicomonas sp. Alg238-R29]|nr:hypothetical protein [Parendozoicomonas sp. Alg238-R29]
MSGSESRHTAKSAIAGELLPALNKGAIDAAGYFSVNGYGWLL